MSDVGKKKRKTGRKIAGALLVVAIFSGLGFVVAKGDVRLTRNADVEEALSTVRQALDDAEERLRSSEIFDGGIEKDALMARLNELEAQVASLTKGSLPESADAGQSEELVRRVELELSVTEAFDLEGLEVRAEGAVVVLDGVVRSTAERLLAVRIAREIPGVLDVVDELDVHDSPSTREAGRVTRANFPDSLLPSSTAPNLDQETPETRRFEGFLAAGTSVAN